MATEANPKSNRLFIVIGVMLAMVAAGMVLLITRSSSSAGGGQTTPIVVAKVDLAQGVAITGDMLDTQPYPSPVSADAEISTSAVIGQTPNVPVKAHSPILQSMLLSSSVQPLSGSTLAITKGDVAMAIPTSSGTSSTSADLQNVGNYVQPEDHIDIMIADATGVIKFSFQDVRVLRVGISTGAAPAAAGAAAPAAATGTPTILLIELPRNQAELMTYLITRPVTTVDAQGKPSGPINMIVKYVLRSRAEYTKDPKTPNYITNEGTPLTPAPDPGAGPAQMTGLFGIH